jgi:hypothetical protein
VTSFAVHGPDGRDPREVWEERLSGIDIDRIANTFGIAEVSRLRNAVGDAAQAYHAAQFAARYGGPDRLDEIEELIGKLSVSLEEDVSRHFLFVEIHKSRGLSEAEKFEDLPRLLEVVRKAASKVVRPVRRGRRAKKGDLRAAYRVLVRFWSTRSFTSRAISASGTDEARETVAVLCSIPGGLVLRLDDETEASFDDFTRGWDYADGRLVPISPAARFLDEVMKMIDPQRPRLPQELRRLMAETVKAIPGRRRGRKLI